MEGGQQLFSFFPIRAGPSWAKLALVVVVGVVTGLSLNQMVNRFKTIHRELGLWLGDCGNWLQVVDTAAMLVLE